MSLQMYVCSLFGFFFFSSRRRHTRWRISDWSSDVCSSDLLFAPITPPGITLVVYQLPTLPPYRATQGGGTWGVTENPRDTTLPYVLPKPSGQNKNSAQGPRYPTGRPFVPQLSGRAQ